MNLGMETGLRVKPKTRSEGAGPHLLCNIFGNKLNQVVVISSLQRGGAVHVQAVKLLQDIAHKAVKMDAELATILHRGGLVEEVHQHTLATAHSAPERLKMVY